MSGGFQHLGNLDLLESKPVAFFCSTRCDGDSVLKAYEWARKQCDLGTTVISGFHTPVEKDVYAILARRGAGIILCLPRRLPKRLIGDQKKVIDDERLLLITPSKCKNYQRATKESCSLRNDYAADKATKIVIPFLHSESTLAHDLEDHKAKIHMI